MAVLCDSTPEQQVFPTFVWGGPGLGTRVLLRVGGNLLRRLSAGNACASHLRLPLLLCCVRPNVTFWESGGARLTYPF